MKTTEIGNKLEDQLYEYLIDQSEMGEWLNGAFPPELCQIRQKAKYPSRNTGRAVEFDVVIEARSKGRTEPILFVVFECKNHKSALKELYVRDFESKLASVFGHAAKGIVVTSNRLQSGADSLARSLRLGIVKFDSSGLNTIADRSAGRWHEPGFIAAQIFTTVRETKSLKFSGVIDGTYFASPLALLQGLEVEASGQSSHHGDTGPRLGVPFLTEEALKLAALQALYTSEYSEGAVDVEAVCRCLNLELICETGRHQDVDGRLILGSADFQRRRITVYKHDRSDRERFTIAHEIGHFCLNHETFLQSDSIVEADLFTGEHDVPAFNYERMEYQANLFASLLLLPELTFFKILEYVRLQVGIADRGFG